MYNTSIRGVLLPLFPSALILHSRPCSLTSDGGTRDRTSTRKSLPSRQAVGRQERRRAGHAGDEQFRYEAGSGVGGVGEHGSCCHRFLQRFALGSMTVTIDTCNGLRWGAWQLPCRFLKRLALSQENVTGDLVFTWEAFIVRGDRPLVSPGERTWFQRRVQLELSPFRCTFQTAGNKRLSCRRACL